MAQSTVKTWLKQFLQDVGIHMKTPDFSEEQAAVEAKYAAEMEYIAQRRYEYWRYQRTRLRREADCIDINALEFN